jgi:hypothetical protein
MSNTDNFWPKLVAVDWMPEGDAMLIGHPGEVLRVYGPHGDLLREVQIKEPSIAIVKNIGGQK